MIPVGPFRKVPSGKGTLLTPFLLPNLELALVSILGVLGTNGGTVGPWPDQSGKGRDAANDTANGNNGVMRLTTNASPNGQQAVTFSGADYPHDVIGSNALPVAWPATTNGYTFYVGFNGKAAVNSAPPIQIIWNDATLAHYRFGGEAGGKWFYFDQNQVIQASNTPYATGNQSAVVCNQANGTLNLYVNGVAATWQGGWNQQWNINPAILNGYQLGNLSTNHVVGWHADAYWFLWYSQEHNAQTRSFVDNYMRQLYGLAPV